MTDAKTIQANRQRSSSAHKLHEQRDKERADAASNLKAAYQAERDSLTMQNNLKISKQFIAYHQKIAQDGQGARQTGHKLVDGTSEIENYFLSSEERLSHLDKAAGIQEFVDYLERQTKLEKPTPNADLSAAVDETEE